MRSDFDILGEPAIYPGHPLTLAYIITHAFKSFEEADAPTCHGWVRALSDNRVPGAGDCVQSAMDALRQLRKGVAFDEVVAWSNARWTATTSNGYTHCTDDGIAQFRRTASRLREQSEWWTPRPSGAVLDETRRYRYRLWRTVSDLPGSVAFIMLNPSTADENDDDPTIRKCMSYTRTWGFGRLIVVNLFAFRATDPKEILAIKELDRLVGQDNDAFLEQIVGGWGGEWDPNLIVCAWGKNGGHLERDRAVLKRFHAKRPPHYLKLTNDGKPYHPLYLKGDLKPSLLLEATTHAQR